MTCRTVFVGWFSTGTMNEPRVSHTASTLTNGNVLVAGGSNGHALNSTELYDASTGILSLSGRMKTARYHHTATVLQDGKVLVTGGVDDSALMNEANECTIAVELSIALSQMRKRQTYQKGLVLRKLTGSDEDGCNTTELYDPSRGIWTTTGDINGARFLHTAVLLLNGKVLIFGGNRGSYSQKSAELYDPLTGSWNITGSMSIERFFYASSILKNGKVLVTGGIYSGLQASAELYDPSTEIWTSTSDMNTPRVFHTASLLTNGKVLVVGGIDGYGVASTSVELYDPSSELWTGTGSLNDPRTGHTAVVLSDGKVMVSGGCGDDVLDTSELYDPVTESWTTSNMTAARHLHQLSNLKDGTVLATGGYDNGKIILKSTEIYIQ